MREFIELVSLDENTYKRALELSQFCENRKKSEWTMLEGCLMLTDTHLWLFCFYYLHLGNIYCGEIFDIISLHISTKVPPLGTSANVDTCLIFDEMSFKTGQMKDSPDVLNFCGVSIYIILSRPSSLWINMLMNFLSHHLWIVQDRTRVYYTQELAEPDIIHFDSYDADNRLLSEWIQYKLMITRCLILLVLTQSVLNDRPLLPVHLFQ